MSSAHPAQHHIAIGRQVRIARVAAQLNQQDLGARVGFSASVVSRIEAGKRPADVATLLKIADVLCVPPEHFGLTRPSFRDTPGPADQALRQSVPARLTHDAREGGDPVERRGFLAGVAALGAGALGAAIPSAPTQAHLTAELDRALFQGPPPGPPVELAQLRAGIAAANADYQAARYARFATRLPRLITGADSTRRALSGSAGEAAAAALADTLSLTSEWCTKLNDDALAWVTADRAFHAARESGDPRATAEAARAMAIAMRRSGHNDAANALLTDVAAGLGTEGGNTTPAVLAVYGSLMLSASYSAAQSGRRSDAEDLLAEAAATAVRMHDNPKIGLFASTFGIDQVNVYGIGIHHALGNDVAALEFARAVRVAALPTIERRARFCVDLARTHQALGNTGAALQALLAAERFAPEDVRRPSVRALTAELLYSPGNAPGLRTFAQRTGVHI